MKFQSLLSIIYELYNQGVTALDSGYLAALLKQSIAKVSKDLLRLHQMGFLKRTRFKRECFTKNGKLCYKGYRYEYSLSSQGLKYMKWMLQTKPFEDAILSNIFSETSSYVSNNLKESISLYIAYKDSLKYKGSNRFLQSLGVYAFALPNLTSSLKNLHSRNEELKNKCKNLEESLNQANKRISELLNENSQLKQTISKIILKSFTSYEKLLKIIKLYGYFTKALEFQNETYRKMIIDVGLILIKINSKYGFKLFKLVEDYYSKDLNLTKEYFKEVEKLKYINKYCYPLQFINNC